MCILEATLGHWSYGGFLEKGIRTVICICRLREGKGDNEVMWRYALENRLCPFVANNSYVA